MTCEDQLSFQLVVVVISKIMSLMNKMEMYITVWIKF